MPIVKPPLTDTTKHITADGKPTKDFYNWIKGALTKYITADSTDTLKNKTITDITDVLGGVTMTLGSDATGDIYYRNSSGILTRLPIGSAGKVLEVSGGLPSWQPAPTQSVTLLNTLTASSSASLQDTTSLTSTYENYMVVLERLIAQTASQSFLLTYQVSGTFQTTGYRSVTSVTTGIVCNSGGLASPTVSPGIGGVLYIHNPSANDKCLTDGFVGNDTTSTYQALATGGFWNTAGVVTGIKFAYGSGNIVSGTIKIYGITG